jgi:hypothetical protein
MGHSEVLYGFNNIRGNDYIVNDVVFVLIFASYLNVLVGLAFYASEVVDDLSSLRSNIPKIEWIGRLVLFFLFTVGFALTAYACVTVMAYFGFSRDIGLSTYLNVDKVLSLVVFFLFFITDSLFYISQKLQIENLSNDIKARDVGGTVDGDTELRLEKNRARKRFSHLSIWLVDIPMISVTGVMITLTYCLAQCDQFHLKVENALHNYPLGRVPDDVFGLFLNGVSVGIIASTMMFSQIVYVMLTHQYDVDMWGKT